MTRKSSVKSAKRVEGETIRNGSATLEQYIKHFKHFVDKSKGKNRLAEIDSFLSVARGDLNDNEFLQLETIVAPETVKKRERKIARAMMVSDGATRADMRRAKFDEAQREGIWYPKYPDGCVECGSKDRKHYSGGRCTRCYTNARNEKMRKAIQEAQS